MEFRELEIRRIVPAAAIGLLLSIAALPLAAQDGTPAPPGAVNDGGIEEHVTGVAGPDVAVLAYCADLAGPFGGQNAVDTLVADGRFASVTLIDGDVVMPTAQDLLDDFECALAVTDNRCGGLSPSDALAGYVQGGGGLVLATFGYSDTIGFTAPIFAPGLSPLLGEPGPNATAGSIDLAGASTTPPCDILLNGVSAPLDSDFANFVGLAAGATLCASYDAGEEALAVNAGGTIVGLNSFPFSADDNLQASYRQLLGNSMDFVCGEAPPTIEVPVLSTVGLVLLVVLLIALSLMLMRRRPAV